MSEAKNIKISVMITEEEVQKRIAEMGAEITKRFEGESIYMVCVLKGSVFFTTALAQKIDLPMEMDFMMVSSYGAATVSSGVINIKQDLTGDIEGKNVLLVEDIIDSGNTLSRLMQYFKSRNPKSLTLCTLLDKPERRIAKDVVVDYTGFVIPDKFVIGYGLDWDQKYRNLPYIGVVEEE